MASKKESEKQQRVLKDLGKLAQKVGLRVSYGDMKFAGLRLKSGQCLFRGERWLVLGSNQDFEEKFELFMDALTYFELSRDDLSPEVMEYIDSHRLFPSTTENKYQDSEA